MTKNNYKGMNAGFTLIELLVVISIIGMMSSVVISSVNAARDKAEDAYTAGTISEYTKAMMMYYNDNGHYPIPSSANNFCLSTSSCVVSTKSLFSVTNTDPTVISGLSTYLPTMAKIYKSPLSMSLVHSGVARTDTWTDAVYRCNITADPQCSTATIQWVILPGEQCQGGAIQTPISTYGYNCTVVYN